MEKKKNLMRASLLALGFVNAGLCDCVGTKERTAPVTVKEMKMEKKKEVEQYHVTCRYMSLPLNQRKDPFDAAMNGKPFTTPLATSDQYYIGDTVPSLHGVTKYVCEYDAALDLLSLTLSSNDNVKIMRLEFRDAKHAFLATQEIWQQGMVGDDYVVTLMGGVISLSKLALKKRWSEVKVTSLAKALSQDQKYLKERLRLGQIPVVQFHMTEYVKVDSLSELITRGLVGIDLFVTEFADSEKSYSRRYALRFKEEATAGELDVFSYGGVIAIAESMVEKDVNDPKIIVRNDWASFQDRVQNSINEHQDLMQKEGEHMEVASIRSSNSRQEDHQKAGLDKTGTSFVYAE